MKRISGLQKIAEFPVPVVELRQVEGELHVLLANGEIQSLAEAMKKDKEDKSKGSGKKRC